MEEPIARYVLTVWVYSEEALDEVTGALEDVRDSYHGDDISWAYVDLEEVI